MTIKKSIQEFTLHCKMEKNLSIKTRKAYGTDLLQFSNFIREKTEINTIDRVDIRQFLGSMDQLTAKTIKRKIATIKSFFNYLEFEDKITINPFRKMRIRIKEEKKLPSVMSITEISRILRQVYLKQSQLPSSSYGQFESLRNIIVIELLFNTGARVSEIANLKAEHIQLDSGTILIKGKGNKERILHICNR
ncbi:MAG TPA: site-specific integrase, partial [Chitinophagaceae bacterium]|nr:site-specific integrase [Chitinophagaceae bacterium]